MQRMNRPGGRAVDLAHIVENDRDKLTPPPATPIGHAARDSATGRARRFGRLMSVIDPGSV